MQEEGAGGGYNNSCRGGEGFKTYPGQLCPPHVKHMFNVGSGSFKGGGTLTRGNDIRMTPGMTVR